MAAAVMATAMATASATSTATAGSGCGDKTMAARITAITMTK